MTITILKLTNGIEVAGEAEVSNIQEVVLRRPLQINYRYYIGAAPSVSFVRYNMFADMHSTIFDRIHIINEARARDTFARVYNEHADYYYDQHQKMIDEELEHTTPSFSANEEEHLKKLLEMMPVDGSTMN